MRRAGTLCWGLCACVVVCAACNTGQAPSPGVPEAAEAPSEPPAPASYPARVSRADGGRLVHRLHWRVRWGQGGTLISTGMKWRDARVWDEATGALLGECPGETLLSDDGGVLVCRSTTEAAASVVVWDLAKRTHTTLAPEPSLERRLRAEGLDGLAVSPDGAMLAWTAWAGEGVALHRFALTDGVWREPVVFPAEYRLHSDCVGFLSASLLAVCGEHGALVLGRDAEDGELFGPPFAEAVRGEGGRMMLGSVSALVPLKLDAEGRVVEMPMIDAGERQGEFRALGFVGGDGYAYIRQGRLYVWGLSEGRVTRSVSLPKLSYGARLSLSPSGALLMVLEGARLWKVDVTAPKPALVKVADASRGELAGSLAEHPSAAQRATVWTHHEGVTTVWSAEDATIKATFEAHPHRALSISPARDRVAFGDSDSAGLIAVRPLQGAAAQRRVKGGAAQHDAIPYPLDRVGFAAGGLLWGQSLRSPDLRVHTWDVTEAVAQYRLARSAQTSRYAGRHAARLRWRPRDRRLTGQTAADAGADHKLFVHDGALIVHPPGGGAMWTREFPLAPSDAAASAVGGGILAQGLGGACMTAKSGRCDDVRRVRVWDIASRAVMDAFHVEDGGDEVIVTSDGRSVLVVSRDALHVYDVAMRSLRRVDLEAMGTRRNPLATSGTLSAGPDFRAHLSPDGQTLVMYDALYGLHHTLAWRDAAATLQTRRLQERLPEAHDGASAARIPTYADAALHGDEVVAVGIWGHLARFDARTGEPRSQHTLAAPCARPVVSSADGKVACANPPRLFSSDGSALSPALASGPGDASVPVAFSSGGQLVFFARGAPQASALDVYDVSTGARVMELSGAQASTPIATDPKDRFIAAARGGRRVDVYRRDGTLWRGFVAGEGEVTALAFDDDGRRLAVADDAHGVTVWALGEP